MPSRRIGDSGLAMSRIGLGCVTFGREIDEHAAFEIMDYAAENGITFFDTAESYSDGESERLIGRWLRTRGMQNRIAVETKIFRNPSRTHIAEALDASLERLGLEQVAAYLLHFPDPAVPLEETLEGLTLAVEQNKVLAAGCSNFSAHDLRAALAVSEERGLVRFQVVQPIYNLAAREIEGELLPLARARHVDVVTYSPLGAGFLSGKYSPQRSQFPTGSRFAVKPAHADIYFKPGNFRIVAQLKALSDGTGIPMVRLAMSWVLQNPELSCILIGARSRAHVDNALQAMATPLPAGIKSQMDAWEIDRPR